VQEKLPPPSGHVNDFAAVIGTANKERIESILEQLKTRTESRGYILRQRLPVYPEFLTTITSRPGLLGEKVQAAADREGYAGRDKAA